MQGKNRPEQINCYKCGSFYITHETKHPYGCRIMKFKSNRLPSMEVKASSGLDCQLFTPQNK